MATVIKPFSEIGTTGLSVWYGMVEERFIKDLNSTDGIAIFDEMRRRDPTIRSLLYATKLMARTAQWSAVGASDTGADQEAAEFLESCLDDMSHTMTDAIDDILSMLAFGWFWQEIVYKRREGRDAEVPSQFSDGKVGWRKLAPRRQTSWYRWEMDDAGGVKGMWQWPLVGRSEPAVLIPIQKSLLYQTEPDCGNPEGISLLEACYEHYYTLKNLLPLLGMGFERSFVGLPVFRFTERPNADDKAAVEAMGKALRMAEKAFVSVPPTVEFALESAQSAVSGDILEAIKYFRLLMLQSALADYINLGAGDTGSWALGRDKSELFLMATNGWLDKIEATLNRFAVPRLFAYNEFAGLEQYPQIQHSRVEKPNLPELAQWIQSVSGLIQLTDDDAVWLRHQSGMPEMQEGFGIKEKPSWEEMQRAMQDGGDDGEEGSESDQSPPIEDGNDDAGEMAEYLPKALADFAERPDAGIYPQAVAVMGTVLADQQGRLQDAFGGEPALPGSRWWRREDTLLVQPVLPLIEAIIQVALQTTEQEMAEIGMGFDWGLVNQRAADWAREHAGKLIKGINETTREAVRTQLANWIEAGEDMPALIDRLEPIFGRSRAELIGTTEATRAYGRANYWAWREMGVEGKQWNTASDERVCPICGPVDGEIVASEEPFSHGFYEEPVHPRCRCWTSPVMRMS